MNCAHCCCLHLFLHVLEWMIVDNKQFTPGQPTRAGTLWISSQIPGQVESADVTSVLQFQGYWPSFNIPYFKDLWYALGYGSLVAQYGQWGEYLWDYEASFRSQIFKRDAPNVANLDDMKRIMQENNWQSDPLSRNSAELAISSRMDLATGPLSTQNPSGGIDSKISAASLMGTNPMTVYAKCGPTVEAQAPFVWSTSPWAEMPHEGLPDEFNFDWVTYTVQPLPVAKKSQEIALE